MNKKFITIIVTICLLVASAAAAQTQRAWKPQKSSWYLEAIKDINSAFGAENFDKFIWVDPNTFWIIRPGLGVNQNLLALNLCKNLMRSGQPAGQNITLKFLDTDAYATGKLQEHASVICRK